MTINKNAYIHPAAHLIGDISIGAYSSVWPTAVLRGDMGSIQIGTETSIQDGVICHSTLGFSETLVGNRVTVGHRAVLHGCQVEDDCLIGMGAILLDRCVIQKGSIIGAGALITANTIIPPDSLVLGSPGKIIRQTNDSERNLIALGVQHYVDLIKKTYLK